MNLLSPRSLKGRFALLLAATFVVVGSLAGLGFLAATRSIIGTFGASFARKQAVLEKNRIQARIQREVALCQNLADSPLIRRWVADEQDPRLRAAALEELENYRRHFTDRSAYLIVDRSRTYYYVGERGGQRQDRTYTISRDKPEDRWYDATMAAVEDFNLHVDTDVALGVAKVWINTVIRQDGRKIGLGGSGVEMTDFIRDIVHTGEPGVETILVDKEGYIQGHADPAIMARNAHEKDEAKRLKVFGLLDQESDRSLLKARLAGLVQDDGRTDAFYLQVGGQRRLVAAAYLKDIEWATLVLVDPGIVVPRSAFLPILGLLGASLVLTLAVLTLTLNRLVLSPLGRLTASTEEIAAGRYDARLPVDREDEIGHLTASFNHMTAMVQDHMQNLEQKVEDRTLELRQANRLLTKSNRKVMDSIAYAKIIQSSILAKPEDLKILLPDHLVLWRPRDVVGGDFYALYPDGAGGFLLALGDCTGHGVPGAFMTMAAKALLDQAVLEYGTGDPSVLLGFLNRGLRRLLRQEGSPQEVDNGLDIALIQVGPDRRCLRWASGKIDLWILEPGGTFTELRGDRHSLGYRTSNPEFEYRSQELPIQPGQTFFIFSDGLPDQSGGPKGYGLGTRRLREALQQWRDLPLAEQAAHLEAFIEAYQTDRPQRDDITFIGFRV